MIYVLQPITYIGRYINWESGEEKEYRRSGEEKEKWRGERVEKD